MAIALLGINHDSAPIEVREQVAFDPTKLNSLLKEVCELPNTVESVILSTCNRTEIYVATNNQLSETSARNQLQDNLRNWLTSSHALNNTNRDVIHQALYFKYDQDCLEHLLGVACGLDSMVIGEPQIFGQVKTAYQTANVNGTVQQELDNVFQFVFRTAKRIRTETMIGNHAVSIASAGIQLGQRIFSDFKARTAILIGAGETIQLVAQHLQQHGLQRMIFANRSLDNANRLAQTYQGYSIALSDLSAHLHEGDMIFSSTASPDPILHQQDFINALKKRKRKPMFIIDLAVPRDIETKTKELEDIYLYSIDDLQSIIASNQEARLQEAEKARDIVHSALNEFDQAKNLRNASPAIRSLREHFNQQRDELLNSALEKLNNKNAEQILTQFAHQLTNRFLHQPTKNLRDAIVTKKTDEQKKLLEFLLPENKKDQNQHSEE